MSVVGKRGRGGKGGNGEGSDSCAGEGSPVYLGCGSHCGVIADFRGLLAGEAGRIGTGKLVRGTGQNGRSAGAIFGAAICA